MELALFTKFTSPAAAVIQPGVFRKYLRSFEGSQSIICVGKEPYSLWKVHLRIAELKPLATPLAALAAQCSSPDDVSGTCFVLLKCSHYLFRVDRDLLKSI